nr:cytosolic isocitrate dehydrogenase [NADP] isoform X2 [Ipomoea batatas]
MIIFILEQLKHVACNSADLSGKASMECLHLMALPLKGGYAEFMTMTWLLVMQYRATDTIIKGAGKLKMSLKWGSPEELDVYDFKGPGVALAMYNVRSGSRTIFERYIRRSGKQSSMNINMMMWLKLRYEAPLDRLTGNAYAVKSDGGYVLGMQNYYGDVQSDLLLKDSVLSWAYDFCFCYPLIGKTLEAEAAIGTVNSSTFGCIRRDKETLAQNSLLALETVEYAEMTKGSCTVDSWTQFSFPSSFHQLLESKLRLALEMLSWRKPPSDAPQ